MPAILLRVIEFERLPIDRLPADHLSRAPRRDLWPGAQDFAAQGGSGQKRERGPAPSVPNMASLET